MNYERETDNRNEKNTRPGRGDFRADVRHCFSLHPQTGHHFFLKEREDGRNDV